MEIYQDKFSKIIQKVNFINRFIPNYEPFKKLRIKIESYLSIIINSNLFNKYREGAHTHTIKKKLNSKILEQYENFLLLHLRYFFKIKRGYINVDLRIKGERNYISHISRLPLPDNSVELIIIEDLIEYLPKNLAIKAFKIWWKKLIPGGQLLIKFKDFDRIVKDYLESNKYSPRNNHYFNKLKKIDNFWWCNFLNLKKVLEEYGFKGVEEYNPQSYQRLKETWIKIKAYKSIEDKNFKISKKIWKNKTKLENLTKENKKIKKYKDILDEIKEDLFNRKKCISIGCGMGEIEIELGREGYSITGVDESDINTKLAIKKKKREKLDNINFVRNSLSELNFDDNSFDAGFAINIIEYIEPKKLKEVILEIKRILKPNAKFLITVPNKVPYYDPEIRQFFSKRSLAKLIDDSNLWIDCIDLEEGSGESRELNLLKVIFINKPAVQVQQKRKICAIGAYQFYGYNLLGFHWDGQKRAFKELGYEVLFLDIEISKNYENLKSKILRFNPDILWLGLKDCLLFIEWMCDDIIKLRKNGCKIIYWFCDLFGIEGFTQGGFKPPLINPRKTGQLLDYIFLSNAGQIQDYKNAYGINNVFYMPQACSPSFMHWLKLPEIYDIGFSGTITGYRHRFRKKILSKLSEKYKVIISDKVFNNIANFYSKSRITLGTDYSKIHDVFGTKKITHIYTSNRFYVALGCGAFYICQWFPGIERLAENHKHLIWFKTENELLENVDYYLEHKEEREKIRMNAQELAHSKHTYVHRIQNMFDIIDGKTNSFYGFLK